MIHVNRLFFTSFLLMLVSVFCEQSRTPISVWKPVNTSEDVETIMANISTEFETTTSLEAVDRVYLQMSTMRPIIRDVGITANMMMTDESAESAEEKAVEEPALTRVITTTSASTKSMISEWSEAITVEGKVATTSTRFSTTHSLTDIMPTEFTGALNTSWLTTPATKRAPKRSKFLDDIRTMIKQLMSTTGSELARKLLEADISTDCTFGLLQFMRAIQDLEPWAMRLIDATAKYPTGVLQGTLSDLGAYDECIETVVPDEYGGTKLRGQYCDVHVSTGDNGAFLDNLLPALLYSHRKVGNVLSYALDEALPGLRLGVCFIDACNEQDLANIGRTLGGTSVKITVKDCVTNEYKGVDNVQACIIAFLAVLAAVIVFATIFELFSKNWDDKRKKAIYYKCVTAFSVVRNTSIILHVGNNENPETQQYKFVHGLRFLSMFWICLGHSYQTINENITRLINAVHIFERWESPIITAGFMAVDTFFFMSGYLLYYVLNKQNHNRAMVAGIALLRRFIRGTIPMFFMFMCMYLLPLIASGPNSKEFYDRFHAEIRLHWSDLVLHIRNWRLADYEVSTMPHLWYLSADFQLFVVAVALIQTFGRKKRPAAIAFAVLSLLCCIVSAWQIYGTNMLPFIVPLHTSYRDTLDTVRYYYQLPFYHAVCFFSGCVTFIFAEQYGKVNISKTIQALFWCIALSCGLSCVFMKLEWNINSERPSETKRMFMAFIDRILWSVCIVWFWFTCTTGRGGFLNRFLSWNGFVPLARISFGVYLIHLPFYNLMHRISRERRFYSHFTLVSNCFLVLVWSYLLSYIQCVACELPVAHLEKLVFVRDPRNAGGTTEEPQKQQEAVGKETENIPVVFVHERMSKNCSTEA